ncbi:MAG: heme exporter protein CcmD [Bacteroidales bacterium]|nr:heme exporter protein CcmD [Bacteroidales bacterium]
MKYFSPPTVLTIQTDTAYVVNVREPVNWDDGISLDSLFSAYPIDTLYGEDVAQLSRVSYSGAVYPIWAIIGIVAIVLIILLVWMLLCILRRHERQRQEVMSEVQQLVNANRISNDAVSSLIEERIKLMQTLLSNYKEDVPSGKNLPLLDYVEHLQSINENYKKTIETFNGNREFMNNMEHAINASKNNIMARVRAIYGNKISDNDYIILTGLFAKMSPAAISFLTGVKEGTIRVKKSRFAGRFEKLDNLEEKEFFLKELYNN